jgi:hypothetical protein
LPRRTRREPRFDAAQRRAAVQAHTDPGTPDQDQRPCACGDHCEERTEKYSGGTRVITAKLGYRAFCDADRGRISDQLGELPGQYEQLAGEYRVLASAARQQHGKASAPPLLIRGDVDALMREMANRLASWANRVSGVARLAPVTSPDPVTLLREGARITAEAVDRLQEGTHLSALLALGPAPMGRSYPERVYARIRGDLPAGHWIIVEAGGYVTIRAGLDGAWAGLEILQLRHWCRAVLGETTPRPEDLLGVACYNCQHRRLRRADQDRADEREFYSVCRRCRHKMKPAEYRQHIVRLAAGQGGRRVTPVLQ